MLFDTSAWIEYFKVSEQGKKVKQMLQQTKCYTCSLSIAELSEWLEKNHFDRKKYLSGVKSLSEIIDPSHEILEVAGILKFKKRETINDFGLIDAIILATAKQYEMQIVTKDRHFVGENVLLI